MNTKFIPVVILVFLIGLVAHSVFEPTKKVEANDGLSKEQIIQGFQAARTIDIKVLERIEIIEKKLNIKPPKNSIKLMKKDEKTTP